MVAVEVRVASPLTTIAERNGPWRGQALPETLGGTRTEPGRTGTRQEDTRVTRRPRSDEDWAEDHDDDRDDLDDGDSTLPCPYCQRPIYADAPRCPYCENYLSEEDAAPARRPWWIALGVGVCLYLVYRWTVGR